MSEYNERPVASRKRDRKRWCRGKKGVEHQTKCFDYGKLKGKSYCNNWLVLVCTVCGKEVEHWWTAPSPWMPPNRPKPDWVVEFEKTLTEVPAGK